MVFDQRVIDRLQLGEFNPNAASWRHVTHHALGVERVLAAYFYADVRTDGKFSDGCEHAANAQIAKASSDAVKAIAVTDGYRAIFFRAVKQAL